MAMSMERQRLAVYSLSVLIFILGFCPRAVLAAPATIPTVTLQQLDIIETDLPYQTAFNLTGNRNLFVGNADAAKLTIVGGGKTNEYFWWRTNPNGSNFTFLVTEGLEYGASYKLTFEAWAQTSSLEDVKAQVRTGLWTKLEDHFLNKSKSITADEVQAIAKSVVNQVIAGKQLGNLKFDKGKIEWTTADPDYTKIDFAFISNLVRNSFELRDNKAKAAATVNDIRLFALTKSLQLSIELTNYKESGVAYFTTAEVAAVIEFLNNQTPINNLLTNKLYRVKAITVISAEFKDMLTKVTDLSQTLVTLAGRIALAQATVSEQITTYNTLFDFVFSSIYTSLGSGLILTKTVTGDKSVTNLQALRISPIIGAGTAFIGSDGTQFNNIDRQIFAYLAFKYYFFPVDKRVPDPWLRQKEKHWKARTYALFGWRIGNDIQYKGKPLGDVIGIKPVIGAGIDLNRFLSLDLTAIAFTQASSNPFEAGSKVKLAPCISLSIDLDLFNRLKNALNGTGYSVPGSTPTPATAANP